MFKYFILILILPVLLSGQEQVSDIRHFGVNEPTNLTGRAGFANINGDQYFLQENDSLTIYKIESDILKLYAVIQSIQYKQRSPRIFYPNRSLFEIRDGKYFRFFIRGVQVIDIEAGTEIFRFDFDVENFTSVTFTAIHSDRIYFRGNRNNIISNYALDISTGNIKLLDLPTDREHFSQMLQFIPGVETGRKFYMFDANQNRDSLIYESQSGIKLGSYTSVDSIIAVIENSGQVLLADHSLKIRATGCIVGSVADLKAFKLSGNRLVAVLNHPNEDFRDIVKVIDLNNCAEELSFITETRQYYAENLQFVFNENNDARLTIFGYSGENPTDGFNQGLYYIIDHENNHFKPINNLSQIQSFTPFIFDVALYSIGIDGSFWGSRNYILKYDLETFEFRKLYPAGLINTNRCVLGFPIENEIVTAANSIHETPVLWKFNEEEEFFETQALDFSRNLGVHLVDKIFPLSQRIYFTNNVGIYSVFEDGRLEFPYNNQSKILGSTSRNVPIATYNNKMAFCELGESRTVFRILDTSTGERDSLVLNESYSNSSLVSAGPFIFFSKGNSNSELKYFDLKTKSVSTYYWLPFMISPNIYRGEKRAVYLEKSFSLNQPTFAHQINYETNYLDEIAMDFRWQVEVVPGYDDSFYFIDQSIGAENCRIRLFKKDGTLETIYDGVGTYYKTLAYTRDKNTPATVINLMHKGLTSVIVANDLQKTQVITLPHLHFAGNAPNILTNHTDKFILRTNQSDGIHYWFYKPFSDPEEIEGPNDYRFMFGGLTDSLAVLVFRRADSSLILTKYDPVNTIRDVIDNPASDCILLRHVSETINIQKNQILMNAFCQEGYEPWILDADAGSFKLLSDINPGEASSLPSDFIRYKDWIYFTAMLQDNSRQWFRTALGTTVSVPEPVNFHSNGLTVYPIPTSEFVQFDQDLEEIKILSANGQMIQHIKNYRAGNIVHLGHLENGIYLYNASDYLKRWYSGKLIILK